MKREERIFFVPGALQVREKKTSKKKTAAGGNNQRLI
jgi:hypothetical protein